MKKPITRIDLIADMLGAQSAVVRQRQELRRLNAALVRRNTTIRRLRARLAFERDRGDEPQTQHRLPVGVLPGDGTLA